jgi:formylglycine-generating enzyme required for sulfatase activity
MYGNAEEWVEDCYHSTYQGAPADDRPWTTGECTYRVLRGGSWNNGASGVRSAYRFGAEPGAGFDDDGFRIARSLTP